MATEREEIIYSIKLDIDATNEALKTYGSNLTEIKKIQGEMNATTKEQLDLAEREEKAKKKTKEAIDAEAGSIAALREQNKQLTRERNSVSLATEEGRRRVAELNKQLDENNKIIKDNVDAYTKQKIGIGDYSGALDKLIPGLGATTSGLKATGKEMWALVTNPLGAVIAALGLAFGALIKYFKGSEEGQNRLNQIMLIGGTIMEKIMDVVENVGEAIFNAFTSPKQALVDLVDFMKNQIINRFTAFAVILDGIVNLDFKKVANGVLQFGTGVEDVIGKTQKLAEEVIKTFDVAIQQANRLASLQAKIDEDERKAVVERARVALEVAKLREQAVSQEGDAKRKTIEEAIQLEKRLSDAEVARAATKLEQAKLELKTNGDDKEAKMKVAEAEAALINAQAQRYEATLRFQKELERLNDEEIKLRQQRADEDEKFWKDADDRAFQATQESLERDKKAREKALKDAEEVAKKKKLIDQQVTDQVNKNLGSVFANQQINYKAGFELFKKGALTQLLAETNKAAVGAMASASSIPLIGWLLGPLAYATTYAKGIASYFLVQGMSLPFERGGIAATGGVLRGRSHKQGGIPFTVAGQGGFEAEGGEAIINKRSTALFRKELSAINAAGGGVRFAAGGITGMSAAAAFETRAAQSNYEQNSTSREILNELRYGKREPILVVQDYEAAQMNKNLTENRARVI